MESVEVRFGIKSKPFFELSPYYFSTFVLDGAKWRTLMHVWCGLWVRESFHDAERVHFLRCRNSPYEAYSLAVKWGMSSLRDLPQPLFLHGIGTYLKQDEGVVGVLLSTGDSRLLYEVPQDLYLYEGNRYGKLLESLRGKLRR